MILISPIPAISISVVFDIKKWPKKSVGRVPADVRTRITASNATGFEIFFSISTISRSPSMSAWKYVYLKISPPESRET